MHLNKLWYCALLACLLSLFSPVPSSAAIDADNLRIAHQAPQENWFKKTWASVRNSHKLQKRFKIASLLLLSTVCLAGGITLTCVTGGLAAPGVIIASKLVAGALIGGSLSSGFSTVVKAWKEEEITLKDYGKEFGIGAISGIAVAGAGVGVAALGLKGVAAGAAAGAAGGGTSGLVRGTAEGVKKGIKSYRNDHNLGKAIGLVALSAVGKTAKGALLGAATGGASMAGAVDGINGVNGTIGNIVGGIVYGAGAGAIAGAVTEAGLAAVKAKKGTKLKCIGKAAITGGIGGLVGGAIVGGIVGATMASNVHKVKEHVQKSWEKGLDANAEITNVHVSHGKVHLNLNGDIDVKDHITCHLQDRPQHPDYNLDIRLDAHNTLRHNDHHMHTKGSGHVEGKAYMNYKYFHHHNDINNDFTFNDKINTRLDLEKDVFGFKIRHHIDLPTVQPDVQESNYVTALAAGGQREIQGKICGKSKSIAEEVSNPPVLVSGVLANIGAVANIYI